MTRNREAQTAFGPRVLSAVEFQEPPERRVVDDDLATLFLPLPLRVLVGAARIPAVRRGLVAASERSGPGLWASTCCRKRYLDNNLAAALAAVDAVVVLGAGLDTRAARLAQRSDVPVFEVDQPINVARKQNVLTRVFGAVPSTVRLVGVDFERDDLVSRLVQRGYEPGSRTFFVWEGVTQYLSRAAVDATFAQLASAAPGSRLDFTYVRQDFIDGANLYGAAALHRRFRERHHVWKSGFSPVELPDYLASRGWRLIEQAGADEFASRYVAPTGRRLDVSALELSVYAEKAT